jgi:hypothetical protein
VCCQYWNWSRLMKKSQSFMVPNFTTLAPVLNYPFRKHMGCEPSQQPPLWWNISGPLIFRSRSIVSQANGVARILAMFISKLLFFSTLNKKEDWACSEAYYKLNPTT